MSKLIHQLFHALHIDQQHEHVQADKKSQNKIHKQNKPPLNLSHNSMSVWQMDKEA